MLSTKAVIILVCVGLVISFLLDQYYLLYQIHAGETGMSTSSSTTLRLSSLATNRTIHADPSFRSSSSSLLRLSEETNEKKKRRTKIIAVADHIYRDTAIKWYNRLTALGYDAHTIVAVDRRTERDLSDRGYRVDYIGGDECNLTNYRGKMYVYRRHIFASRWAYIWRQLRSGTHVLLTDVDNTFNRHLPMSELESAPYDIFHAFTKADYPKSVYKVWNFALCGGMVWLRSAPSVLKLVEQLVQRCKCVVQNCSCLCDDQIELNNLHLLHGVAWSRRIVIPNTTDYFAWDWGGLEGYCNVTGSRIWVWDRHTAYRGHLPENRSQCPRNNWVTMPYAPPTKTRYDLPELWRQACGDPIASNPLPA